MAKLKKYDAIVWTKEGSESPVVRLSMFAEDGYKVLRELKEKYGEDAVISISNEEDENAVR